MASKNILEADGVLHSPNDGAWKPWQLVGESYFTQVRKEAEALIEHYGDWVWLADVLRDEKLTAAEALRLAKWYGTMGIYVYVYAG